MRETALKVKIRVYATIHDTNSSVRA